MRAMVIDDSRAMRMILKRMIGKLDFESTEAADGQEALDLLETMPEVPDLALIDWNMPVMNGLEFVIRCRADPRLQPMTLVMVRRKVSVPLPVLETRYSTSRWVSPASTSTLGVCASTVTSRISATVTVTTLEVAVCVTAPTE